MAPQLPGGIDAAVTDGQRCDAVLQRAPSPAVRSGFRRTLRFSGIASSVRPLLHTHFFSPLYFLTRSFSGAARAPRGTAKQHVSVGGLVDDARIAARRALRLA